MPASDIGARPKVMAKIVDMNSPPSVRPPSPRKLAQTLVPAPARPKARISATATVQPRRVSGTSSVVSSPTARPTSATSATALQFPPRSTSPFKPRSVVNSAISPPPSTTTAKPRVVIRSPPAVTTTRPGTASTRASPELKPQASNARLNDQPSAARKRGDSLTLRHSSSISSIGIRTPVNRQSALPGGSAPSASVSPAPSPSGLAPGPLRITSKVTGGAKKGPHGLSLSYSTPSSPAATDIAPRPAPGSLRIRAPSAQKRPSLSLDSPTSGFNSPLTQSPSLPTFSFPDATSSPNLARMSLPRRPVSPTDSQRSFPPSTSEQFTISLNDPIVPKSRGSISAKVDPALIPLPLASPPISSVSFSSRSSVSSWTAGSLDDSGATGVATRSSPPGAAPSKPSPPQPPAPAPPRLQPPKTPPPTNANVNGLLMMLDIDASRDDITLDNTPDTSAIIGMGSQTQAKSNRKIADLEISNRSLLAINSSLEAAKHRQAKELRELRRRLRESRLSLPPREFRALQAREGAELEQEEEDDEEEEEEEEEDDKEQGAKGEADAAYWRVRSLVDSLLESGKRALEVKPVDLVPAEGSKGAAKVLSAEEVRSWRRDSAAARGNDTLGGDLSMISEGPSSRFGGDDETEPGDSSIADDADTTGVFSEEDVDTSMLLKDLDQIDPVRSHRHSLMPPIVVSSPRT